MFLVSVSSIDNRLCFRSFRFLSFVLPLSFSSSSCQVSSLAIRVRNLHVPFSLELYSYFRLLPLILPLAFDLSVLAISLGINPRKECWFDRQRDSTSPTGIGLRAKTRNAAIKETISKIPLAFWWYSDHRGNRSNVYTSGRL